MVDSRTVRTTAADGGVTRRAQMDKLRGPTMRMLFWIARRARAVLPRAFDLSRRVVRQPKTETRQNEELLHSTPAGRHHRFAPGQEAGGYGRNPFPRPACEEKAGYGKQTQTRIARNPAARRRAPSAARPQPPPHPSHRDQAREGRSLRRRRRCPPP
jgi:hypothetical protein